MGPPPETAAVRRAVRRSLAGLPPHALVLVAGSGGGDSNALAAAMAFEAPKHGLRVGFVTVDHGLQAGSAGRAREIAARLTDRGFDPVEVVHVHVGGVGGPEAAARAARYAALSAAAARHSAAAVLLGHTLDDQAETVLLGLARGSGARSLSGMAACSGIYRRPLLDLRRSDVRRAADQAGLPGWDDPHNADPRFARVRVRLRALPVLEAELGPGVTEALARTARLLRDDADALDEWAGAAARECTAADGSLRVDRLADLPAAVRRRVLRQAALAAGCPATDLFARHIGEVDRLVTGWRGQRWVDLPGARRAVRRSGRLLILADPTQRDQPGL